MVLFAFLLTGLMTTVSAQMALLYDFGRQTPNCPVWSDYGSCIWFNAAARQSDGLPYGSRWGRSYRDQLEPQCYRHQFYKRAALLYGEAIGNVMNHFSSVISDRKPCGMCSYQQSCGAGKCDHKKYQGHRNSIFVAERLCQPSSLGGHKQNVPCTADYSPSTTNEDGQCQIWPPQKGLQLPRVSESKKELLFAFQVSTCVTVQSRNGRKSCKCCCFPFHPNDAGTECLLNRLLRHLAPPGWHLED